MKQLNETINEYSSFFQHRNFPFIERKSFQTPKDSQATFTFCSGMFYEDFYKGLNCLMPDKEAIHQYVIRTDNFYRIGYSPKHLLFFNMLGLFEFNKPNKYENLEGILEFLTRLIDPSKLSINIPQKIESDQDYLFIINKQNIKYKVLFNEKLQWTTSLNSSYKGLRVEINYQNNNLGIELWNIGYIESNGELIAIDSGVCAERLNLAQNNLSNIYDISEFKKIKLILRNIPKKRKNYFLNSSGLEMNMSSLCSDELNLIADLYRTTHALIESGVLPCGKKDRKGMHLRNLLKKQFASMYVANLDLDALPELYGKYSSKIKNEIDLFHSKIRLESIDTRLSEIKGIMRFLHPFKGDKFFRNKSKQMTLTEFKNYRKDCYGRLTLDDLYGVKDLVPFEISMDWAVSNGLLDNSVSRPVNKFDLKKMCNKYKTNLIIFKRSGLL